MITNDGMLEIEEQEGGTYIFPNSKVFASTWALYVYKDGRAELYTKRDLEKGSLLGKPIDLGKPVIKIHPLDMCELLDKAMPIGSKVNIIKMKNAREHQEVHEILGKRYFQTTSVPAVTKILK